MTPLKRLLNLRISGANAALLATSKETYVSRLVTISIIFPEGSFLVVTSMMERVGVSVWEERVGMLPRSRSMTYSCEMRSAKM